MFNGTHSHAHSRDMMHRASNPPAEASCTRSMRDWEYGRRQESRDVLGFDCRAPHKDHFDDPNIQTAYRFPSSIKITSYIVSTHRGLVSQPIDYPSSKTCSLLHAKGERQSSVLIVKKGLLRSGGLAPSLELPCPISSCKHGHQVFPYKNHVQEL